MNYVKKSLFSLALLVLMAPAAKASLTGQDDNSASVKISDVGDSNLNDSFDESAPDDANTVKNYFTKFTRLSKRYVGSGSALVVDHKKKAIAAAAIVGLAAVAVKYSKTVRNAIAVLYAKAKDAALVVKNKAVNVCGTIRRNPVKTAATVAGLVGSVFAGKKLKALHDHRKANQESELLKKTKES